MGAMGSGSPGVVTKWMYLHTRLHTLSSVIALITYIMCNNNGIYVGHYQLKIAIYYNT